MNISLLDLAIFVVLEVSDTEGCGRYPWLDVAGLLSSYALTANYKTEDCPVVVVQQTAENTLPRVQHVKQGVI